MGRKRKVQLRIDWLKAVILERMQLLDMSVSELSLRTGIGVNRVYKLMEMPVPAWPLDIRHKVLDELQIRVEDLPRDVQMEIAQY